MGVILGAASGRAARVRRALVRTGVSAAATGGIQPETTLRNYSQSFATKIYENIRNRSQLFATVRNENICRGKMHFAWHFAF